MSQESLAEPSIVMLLKYMESDNFLPVAGQARLPLFDPENHHLPQVINGAIPACDRSRISEKEGEGDRGLMTNEWRFLRLSCRSCSECRVKTPVLKVSNLCHFEPSGGEKSPGRSNEENHGLVKVRVHG